MELHIFVTTDRPDQYLNPIVYRIKKGARKIVFVQVEDHRDDQIKQIQLNSLKTNVYNLLENLSKGIYKYYSGDSKDKVVQLNNEYNTDDLANLKAMYSSCLTDDIDWVIKRVSYLKLRGYISAFSKREDVVFDVTSVSKVYIGDIFACSLLENIDKLYTFEVQPNFDKPWKTLIHELEEGKTYRYINLVETPVFKESKKSILIKTMPLFVSVVGTVLFLIVAIAASFRFGFSSIFIQVVQVIGAVLGIISFFLLYFPVRGK